MGGITFTEENDDDLDVTLQRKDSTTRPVIVEKNDDHIVTDTVYDDDSNKQDDDDAVPSSSGMMNHNGTIAIDVSGRSLPLGDMNLLVLTDVHSWIGGHQRHESQMNADYGDVLSLYQRLKDEIRRKYRKDFFMVMNGDFMDGTGLSTTPPEYLTPLLATMPFAIINLGNHELYHEETVEWIKNEFIPHWRGHYLTSNTLWQLTNEPLGSRYVFLEGSHSTLLTFGFLYNFEGNARNTIVEKVEDVVQQPWFTSVLARTDAYDAILVMAHMHVTDPLVNVIRLAIRKVVGPDLSIQFITGHTHIRAYADLDEHSSSFEAGRFLDTIGFCSFPTKAFHRIVDEKDQAEEEPSKGILVPPGDTGFQHAFIEPNVELMSKVLLATHDAVSGTGDGSHSKGPSLDTSPGLILSRRIYETQEHLGLSELVGCSPMDYKLDHAMDQIDSLWGLYMYRIIPRILFPATTGDEDDPSRIGLDNETIPIFVQGTGAFRYKLFHGRVVLDDVIAVCPFNDTIYQFSNQLTGNELLTLLNVTSSFPNSIHSDTGEFTVLPHLAVSVNGSIDVHRHYKLVTPHFHIIDMAERMYQVLGKPVPDPQPLLRTDKVPGDFWTTTNVWKSFIESNWKCTGSDLHRSPGLEGLHRRSHVTQEEQPLTVLAFVLILIVGLYAYQKRKQQLARFGYMPIGDPTTALLRSTTGSNGR